MRTQIYNNNSNETLIFKLIFTSVDDFKSKITSSSKMTDIQLNDLFNICANQYLKYGTDNENRNYIDFVIREEIIKRDRELQLYNKSFDDLLKTTSKNTQTLFLGDRTESDMLNEKYVDNVVLSELENLEPSIRYMDEYKKFIALKNPEIEIIKRIANRILHPLQKDIGGKLW